MIPRSTYRLQLHREFDLDAATAIVPYLARLGVSHVYTSPILTARAGSTHGYDVVDPTRVNPELGGEAALGRLREALDANSMGLIVDIVPNHMAVGGADNPWWLDVIQHGEASAYAKFFDIDWNTPDEALKGKLLLPFLGDLYGEVLANGDLKLVRNGDTAPGRWEVRYFEHSFPLRPESAAELDAIGESGALERYADPDRLHELLELQHFRLAWWRTAGDEINWRRFFEITGLAGLRIEDEAVFEAVHATIFRLYGAGVIDGLRVDHVDGLADPGGYCRRLRARLREIEPVRPVGAEPGPAWIVVEKILAPHEDVPPTWEVDGATGYEFMDQVAGLLHDPAGEEALTRLWVDVSGGEPDFEAEERKARAEILELSFAGQLDAAARAFHDLARARPETRGYTFHAIRRALAALLGVFPAYRIYARPDGANKVSLDTMAMVLEAARPLAPAGEEPVIDFLSGYLVGQGETAADSEADADAIRLALVRFQQLSAPLAAKAVEDTAFYRYGRLLSRTDVGFDATRFALSPAEFHALCAQRAASSPATMLTTATHDHKRGEDVRARLAVLSEVPGRWGAWVQAAFDLSREAGGDAVHPADQYQLFQTIVGAWPAGLAASDAEGLQAFARRVADWQEKALREAKQRSFWTAPDEAYEADARALASRLLDPGAAPAFVEHAARFAGEVAVAAVTGGLAQMVLRLTTPGVPDSYQGTEYWDLSLVDPDNRRPVDYEARRRSLDGHWDWPALLADWPGGHVKQAVLARLLQLRRERPGLFFKSDYLPLEVTGRRADNVLAFARTDASGGVLVVATARLTGDAVIGTDAPLPPARWWGDTAVMLPDRLAGTGLADALNGRDVETGAALPARALFETMPLAVLTA